MRESVPGVFESCTPREDVLTGELAEEQFAASLADVAHHPGDAPSVYSDPDNFFEKTYPTTGIQKLLGRLASRFSHHGTDEYSGTNGVVSLDTAFGGGKTHNQIAAHHLAEHPRGVPRLDEFIADEDTRDAFSDAVDDNLSVNTAVFVGTHVSAMNARCDFDDPNAPNTNTMWGELAYQLFGQEGYEFVKENDENLNPPGSNKLERLFADRENPSLILLDEVAAYLEQASAVTVGNESDLARQTNLFLMSLLKVTDNTDSVTVVISIADTAFAERADVARQLIDDYNEIANRKKSNITPTDDHEIAAVLRHRLFENVDGDAAETVADAYSRYYESNADSFPDEATTADHRARLEESFPVHPTVIDTLTEELDSLPSFQRTRGALKLISRGIHRIWEVEDDHEETRHFVRLHDLHPQDSDVRSTLLGLFQSVDVDFEAAIKADIYSDRSKSNAQVEDETWLTNGHPPLGTQTTTTILWKSIVIGSGGRGTTRRELRHSVAHPEVDLSHYRGALNNLLGEDLDSACFYLFDEQKLRFKSEANINKLIESEAERVQPGVARERLNDMLGGILGDGDLNVIQGPEEPHEVPDEMDTANLCVMDFDTVVIHADDASTPPDVIQTLYENRASSSGGATERRVYKNNVVFLAPDGGVIPEAKRTAARVAGIEHIQRHLGDQYDLNSQQVDELKGKLKTATTDLARAIKRAYRHLYYPGEDGLTHTRIHSVESSDEAHIHDVVLNALTDDDNVLLEDAGAHGGRWFENTVWNSNTDSMSTHDVEEQFAKLRDAPILLSPVPLRETIAELVDEKGWAYWNADDEVGQYTTGDDVDTVPHEAGDAENLTPGMATADVELTGTHYLYESLDALAGAKQNEIAWEDPSGTGGTGGDGNGDGPDGGGGDGGGGGGSGGNGGGGGGVIEDDPLPMTISSQVDQPRHAPRAIEELRTGVDTEIQMVKDDYGYRGDDLAATVDELTINTTGEDAWKHTWFIANQLSDTEGYEEAIVSFAYEAVSDEPDSTVAFDFEGPADVFASRFRVSMEPTDLVGDDGERAGEGTIIVDTSKADASLTHENVLETLSSLLDIDDEFTVKLAADVTVNDGEVHTEASP